MLDEVVQLCRLADTTCQISVAYSTDSSHLERWSKRSRTQLELSEIRLVQLDERRRAIAPHTVSENGRSEFHIVDECVQRIEHELDSMKKKVTTLIEREAAAKKV